jgi:predicted ArsR family transcriptional regulator
MDTSKSILYYLVRNSSATAAELSRSLDLTKADIHYHLRKLQRDGEIEAGMLKTSRGAGRPARSYKRVETPPLKLTRLITSVLLEELMQTVPSETRTTRLSEHIAKEILTCCPSSHNNTSSPTVRLNNLVDELKTFGFILRWEARKKGPQLFFDREAFSLLIEDNGLVAKIMAALADQIQKETA